MWILLVSLASTGGVSSAEVHVRHLGAHTALTVKPWTKLRDDSVVRQQLDYSCGAAALATLLSHYYGEPTTERQVLERQTEPRPATFSTLADLASAFGYHARGYALSLDTLRQLNLPVILYVEIEGNRHFSVLRRVDRDHVLLADPSMGNRVYSRADFLNIWAIRNRDAEEGKALVVLPKGKQSTEALSSSFMRRAPARFGGYTLGMAR